MLLIGSRAIRVHLPSFRLPRDWDLIGTEAEIARLERVLPRSTHLASRPDKAFFHFDGAMVEVANASVDAYWTKVLAVFADEPTIDDPVLGRLAIPPLGYLLATKQCSLIYRVLNWHKNLEDIYFIRDRIPTIPENVAALIPDLLAHTRGMYAAKHVHREGNAEPCHPAVPPPPDPAAHLGLHERVKLGASPLIHEPRAWEGFRDLRGEARRERMIDLFAEETMVMAADRSAAPEPAGKAPTEAQLARWALRTLITSTMPEGLRYFGLNHYREIMGRIPDGWLSQALG